MPYTQTADVHTYIFEHGCLLIMKKRIETNTHVADSAYVYLIESYIFVFLVLGVLTSNNMPIVPTVIFVGLLACLLSMSVGLLGVRLGVVNNTNFALGDPPSMVLSFMQASLEHAFGLVSNFGILLLMLLSDEDSDAGEAYFSILFRADIKQPDLWYLSRAAVIGMLAISMVVLGLLLATFASLRQSIPHKNKKRAHFLGYLNSLVFFNITLQFVMQASNRRICQKKYPCYLQDFVEDPLFDANEHVPVVIVFVSLAICDTVSEIFFGTMRHADGLDIPSLLVYIVMRLIFLVAIFVYYLFLPDDGAGDIFPLWFAVILTVGYTIAVVLEMICGIAEGGAVQRKPTTDNGLSTHSPKTPSRKSLFKMPVWMGTPQTSIRLRRSLTSKKIT